ncbi:mechanosensitive ion channel family protein [Mariprofundus sp. EBB-1]|uniref:mechanosensitive ion channel family protein n=1 Tax=Mariprofundus sp. EBB-1 TaxID=2650971 RepID=UPI001911FD8E|nr:mechanosensitive ion channel family protein [Mariprofundus sp. EBB-1]
MNTLWPNNLIETSWFEMTWLDITLAHWLLAITALFITIVAQRYIVKLFHNIAQKITSRTETQLDNVLLEAAERPGSMLIFVIGTLISVHLLNPPAETFPIIELFDSAGRIVSIFIGVWFLWRLLEGLSAYFTERAKETESSLDDQLVPFIAKTLKVFLVLTAVLVIAQNMGYSISGLIASLGIGGIAIAMAAKDTISNIFGSIMILVDRPFMVGDWIKTAEFEGVVQEVGFRSTRIRTFERTLVNVPNSALANMVIDNIDGRSERRISMRLGLTYDTTPAQMRAAIAGIEEILRNHPGVDQSYKLVKFDEFDASSLSIFLYYFSSSKVWADYLQVRQEVNLLIMDLLEEMNLEFAFPTRTLHIDSGAINAS